MSLITRLTAVLQDIGADVKALKAGIEAISHIPITPIGWFANPSNIVSTGASVLQSGRTYFHPIVLHAGTYDAFVVNLTVAQVGGTVTTKCAIFDEDADGMPDTVSGPLLQATMPALTSTGDKIGVAAAPVALKAKRYWVGVFYYAPVAPTTIAQFLCIVGASFGFPTAGSATPSALDGWFRQGTTDWPTTATTTANITATSNNAVPLAGVRRSA